MMHSSGNFHSALDELVDRHAAFAKYGDLVRAQVYTAWPEEIISVLVSYAANKTADSSLEADRRIYWAALERAFLGGLLYYALTLGYSQAIDDLMQERIVL